MFFANKKQQVDTSTLQSRLFEKEAILKALDQSMATIEFDLQGNILDANENFLKTMGYTLSEIKGKHHRTFCDKDYVNSSDYAAFWSSLSRGEFRSGVFLRIKKNNTQVWLEATYNPIFDNNGNPYKVIKFASDITERKQKANDDENVINAINRSMAVIQFDLNGVILDANENFLKTMGYTLNEIKGNRHSMFVPKDYAQSQPYGEFWNELRSGRFQSGQFTRVHKNGQNIYLEASYNPVFNLKGEVCKVIKFASDISAQVNSNNERNRIARELASQNDALSAEGAEAIQTTTSNIQHIAEVMQTSSSLVSQLNVQSDEITSIIQTIKDCRPNESLGIKCRD